MRPTIIGGAQPSSTTASTDQTTAQTTAPVSSAPIAVAPVDLPADFPVALSQDEMTAVQDKVKAASIVVMSQQEIATLGQGPEKTLNSVLDKFLANIDRFDNPQLFTLIQKLGTVVGKENLPALAERILNHQPSLGEKMVTLVLSPKARKAAMDKFFEQTQAMVKGTSASLVSEVKKMEIELQREQSNLIAELRTMDQLNENYIKLFRDFAVEAAFMQIFLQQSRAELAQFEIEADPNNQTDQAKLIELRDKIQALESRTLALEGSLTRLPADSMVIQQLRNAGIATLQEISTTALGRFASIKQTIVTLNTTMVTKSVQRVANEGKQLDEALIDVRASLMKDVVTTAANAPGDNRIAQAEQIQKIITQTGELMDVVEQARKDNQQKFGQARTMFADARQEMLKLGQRNPY